jgi:NAD(P)-dependent dehydrogenase (short-subunit alcohol dehydrogenase family)
LQEKYSVKAISAQADLGSVNGPAKLVSIAKDHFSNAGETGSGKFQIDIIINNAGIVRPALLSGATVEDFQEQYDVNVRGPMLLVQAAIPYLPTDRSGRIVNISSIGCSVGYWYETIYAGTKGALEAMTRVWARELAEHATVNSVNVGTIDTGDDGMFASLPEEMLQKVRSFNQTTPLAPARKGVDEERIHKLAAELGGRCAYPEEIAGIVGMLCLPEAGWNTGSLIAANGGMLFAR